MRRLLVVTAAQLTMCGRSPETRQVFGEYLQVRYSDTRTNVTMSEIAAHEPAIFLPVSTAHEHWMLVRNRSRRGTINATELPFLPMPPDLHYRGWLRPGPLPPGGIEPEAGETLNYIAGHYRIFQYADGHRFSTDDVLTAWYATQWAPRVGRAADLGSGIGSVALVVAWRLVGARIVTVEAQAMSVRLARKSVRYNGLKDRVDVREGGGPWVGYWVCGARRGLAFVWRAARHHRGAGDVRAAGAEECPVQRTQGSCRCAGGGSAGFR